MLRARSREGQRVYDQETLMTDIEMTPEVEAEDFTEELSDEALDREGDCFVSGLCGSAGS